MYSLEEAGRTIELGLTELAESSRTGDSCAQLIMKPDSAAKVNPKRAREEKLKRADRRCDVTTQCLRGTPDGMKMRCD